MNKTSYTKADSTAVLDLPVPVTTTTNDDANGITFAGLDPILGSLGVLIGLLTKPAEGQNTYTLNPAWFANPINNTKDGITQNPQQFETLLAEVLGKIGGNALGIPVKDAALLGTWYPIKNGEEPTGFYMVSYTKEDGPHPETVMGLGVLHTWKVPPSNPLLTVNVWGLLPFVRIGNGTFKMTFDTPGYPLSIGIATSGGVKDQPLVDINGVSFDGVKFTALVDLPAPDPFSVSLEILSLKLPGNLKATNRSLADLLAITGEEILETATNLFIGALSHAFPGQEKYIRYLTPLFGLSAEIPDLPDVRMPLLQWYNLFKVAANPAQYPGGIKELFFEWFNTISADPTLLKTWVSCLGGFLGNTQLAITGTGTRPDPYKITILSISAIGQLNFTVATDVVDNGIRYFYPGLSLRGNNVALGTSDAVFTVEADLELGQFGLTQQAISASADINFVFQFALTNKTLTLPLIAYDGYSFGSLKAGLMLGTGGKIVPHFTLNQVVTPQSSFDSVNLLSPGELADTGAAVLSDALATLIGVGQKSFSDNIAALIGLIAPGSAGANWPADLAPPFSATQMVNSILNPISAWADYYLKVLKYQSPVDGKAAFAFIVQEMALLLQNTTQIAAEITGDGTPAVPWKAGISLSSTSLPAFLTAYRQEQPDGSMALVMGISLMPVITIAGVDIVPSLNMEAIRLVFPPDNSTVGVSADWFSEVSAKLTLPQVYSTPEMAGVVVRVNASQLSAQWSRITGWSWSMLVNKPTLIINGTDIILGEDLNFDNQTALEDLVKQSAATFSPFLVAALGTSLLRTETRAGLLTTGILGLLPDISKSPVFPPGLSWTGFTQLSLSSLSDPWPAIRNQLASNFSTEATSKSLLALLSYTISPTVIPVPTIKGTGSFDDPYLAPLPQGFEAAVWFEQASKILGLAAGRTDAWHYQQTDVSKAIVKFNFDLNTRLNALKYNLTNGNLIFDEQVPSFSLLGTLYNPDGLLVDLPAAIGSVEKVVLGFNLSVVSGSIKFVPVVNLVGVTLPGQQLQDIITLQDFLSPDFHASMQSGFLALLNGAIQTGIAQVKEQPLFQTAYDLLSMLGLCLERSGLKMKREAYALSGGRKVADGTLHGARVIDETGNIIDDVYGINTAGWNGLLANFDTYIQTQLSKLLSIPLEREMLFKFLEQLWDVKVPTFPTPVLELLAALEICGSADLGYPIYPDAVLELASNPLKALQSRFNALYAIDHVAVLKQLTTDLTRNIPPAKYGPFTFSTDATGVISFGVLPADALTLGGLLNISGGIQLDLNNEHLTGTLNLYCEKIGLTLQNTVTLKHENQQFQTAFESAVVWGDGSRPSATPLVLIPFNPNDFLNQVAALAPAYTLNILLNAVFEEQLLKKYPLIQQIFTGLGLAEDITASRQNNTGFLIELDGNGETFWLMPSLMGILENPLGWLLSDDVLGYNGKFSVAAFTRLLGNLPQVQAPNGISLVPVSNGMNITGLPYGFEVGMSGDAGLANFKFETKNITIADDWGILNNLSFLVKIDENYQPAFSGGLILSSGTKIPAPFYVTTGFDEAFYLKISQGVVTTPTGLSVQLLPFLGWGTLAEQAARLAAAALLNNLVPVLLQKLSAAGAKDFVDRLTAFGNLMDVTTLVNRILAVLTPVNFAANKQQDLLHDVEAVALAWLQERFTVAGAPATVDAMIALLSGVLPGSLSKQGGRLAFKPGNDLPITILAGLNSQEMLGLWVDLALPGTELLKVNVGETGVGVKTDGSVYFSFGVDLVVPLDDKTGPALGMGYSPANGFGLYFDPLGDSENFSYQSALYRELVPFFPVRQGDSNDLSARVTSWLLDVVKIVLPRYVSALILNIDKVKTWLETPIISTPPTGVPTPALILQAMSLIVNNNGRYSLNTIDNLTKLTPGSFFGNLLLTLMQNPLTLLTFGTDNKGSITVGPKKDSAGYYGVRLAAPNLKLAALPNLVLQLGDTGIGADEWIVKSGGKSGEPGVGFYLPIKSENGSVSVDFTLFNLLFYNLGFDFVGTNGLPIVNLQRFKIGKVKPRTVFGLDFKGSAAPDVYFGAAVTLDGIAISLAPDKLASTGGTNPIANNILGSGSSSSGGNPPADPTFSVTTAYSNNLWVNLKSDSGNGNEVILPVERSFGPLYIASLGLGWEDQLKLLSFLFSGSVALAGLKTSVIGLRVGIPVTDPTNFPAYKVDLDGLDISFKGGPVAIQGGFLRTQITDSNGTYISYNGVAVIKAASFSLMALGSYAEVPVSPTPGAETAPSLFIFAVLNAPLGGIPAFFITGVAAGFSFNRSIEIPAITEVQNFPLLKGLVDGTFADGEDPGQALLQLSTVVKPEIGQYWLAAGMKFTSFELITTSALLFLSFGKEWEINLLGLSFASLPPAIPKEFALAYFELAIKVSFKIEQGIISAEAQLTPNSFVLARDCKVTGGFAFFLWYKNITTSTYNIPAGDFVISLGGYHPNFNKPVYYPEVPRLGLQWKMDISVGSISISGGAYFALCPTAVMAGGYINVAYQLGPLKAWLNAYANFLIEWKPFYFNVGIGITIGASFGTTILGVSITIKAELGAQLHLEGPPTHGSVHVDWYVISFTIPIGSGKTATSDNNLNWAGFAEAFLPPPADESAARSNSARAAIAGVKAGKGKPKSAKKGQANADMVQQVVKWNPESGLLNDNDNIWTIQPYPFSFSVKSAIPASLITVANSNFSVGGISVGVRPMGYVDNLKAPVTIIVTDSKGVQVNMTAQKIKMTVDKNGAPGALWSKSSLNREQAPDPATMLIPDASYGLVFNGDEYIFNGDIPEFDILNLQYTFGDPKLLPYKNVAKYPAAARYPTSDQNTAYQVIMGSVMTAATIAKRNILFEALAASEIYAPLNPDLSVMASSANLIFQALPVIARIGIYQNGGVLEAATAVAVKAAPVAAKASAHKIKHPRLQGILKRYKVSRSTSETMQNVSTGVKSQWQNAGGLTRKGKRLTTGESIAHTKTLYDGSVALWGVDDQAQTVLQLDGNLPLRITCFDAYGSLLSFKYVDNEEACTLPEKTAQVAVQGYEAGFSVVTGWQKDTQLSKVNGVWALSDAAMIRVQNSQRIRVRTDNSNTGLLDTADLLKHNKVLGKGDVLLNGWIQSVFPGKSQYIGILVNKASANKKAIAVTILANEIPFNSGLSEVAEIREMDGSSLFIYRCPAGQSADYFGVVVTSNDQEAMVTGMYGFDTLPADVQRTLTAISLNNAGLDLTATEIKSTIVSIQSKTLHHENKH